MVAGVDSGPKDLAVGTAVLRLLRIHVDMELDPLALDGRHPLPRLLVVEIVAVSVYCKNIIL